MTGTSPSPTHDLPTFSYHPDPVATGSAEPSAEVCDVCREPAGLRYTGPVYGKQADVLCLRCIADGRAAAALGVAEDDPAELVDAGWGVPDEVPPEVVVEVSQRTPGYIAWQQERWLYHCADEHLAGLDPDGDLTGYLFRCLHCGTHLAYSDAG